MRVRCLHTDGQDDRESGGRHIDFEGSDSDFMGLALSFAPHADNGLIYVQTVPNSTVAHTRRLLHFLLLSPLFIVAQYPNNHQWAASRAGYLYNGHGKGPQVA